jgi:hypothetical protein
MTISPFIRAKVFPIKVRIPCVRLKSPRIAKSGIVKPVTASRVRVGLVIKFWQANNHIDQVLFVTGPRWRVRIAEVMPCQRASG